MNNNNSCHSKGIKKLCSVNNFIAFVTFGRCQFSDWLIAEKNYSSKSTFYAIVNDQHSKIQLGKLSHSVLSYIKDCW